MKKGRIDKSDLKAINKIYDLSVDELSKLLSEGYFPLKESLGWSSDGSWNTIYWKIFNKLLSELFKANEVLSKNHLCESNYEECLMILDVKFYSQCFDKAQLALYRLGDVEKEFIKFTGGSFEGL